MEASYNILRVFAGSWGAVFLAVSFLGVVIFVLRPGSKKIYRDTANIPFRHDDRPAVQTTAANENTEARP
ncbi:cbb3-type cytochrome oxidase subunit 3 [Rhodophyticola sp. SM2404]